MNTKLETFSKAFYLILHTSPTLLSNKRKALNGVACKLEWPNAAVEMREEQIHPGFDNRIRRHDASALDMCSRTLALLHKQVCPVLVEAHIQ